MNHSFPAIANRGQIWQRPHLECGDTSPLSHDATCRIEPKRGHVRALQN